jgi:hypothetical protein
MRLIHRLSVKIRVFRDSAVSMGGENMRGRGSRGKERPTAGYSQQVIFHKALTFRVPMEESVYKAHLIRPKSFDLTKVYI